MTEQILTITGIQFEQNGRIVAHGAVIRPAEGSLSAALGTGAVQMGTLHSLRDCPAGRQQAALAGKPMEAVFFGERFLLKGAQPQRDWLAPLRRLVGAL